MAVAFRCKNCGHLHEAEHAGELAHPAACRVCGAGVIYRHVELANQLRQPGLSAEQVVAIADQIAGADPAEYRLVPDNWEILADAGPARLQELGLQPEHVAAHTPWPRGDVPAALRPQHHVAVARDVAQVRDAAGK